MQFTKGDRAFPLMFCEGSVKAIKLPLEKNKGRNLEDDLKEKGFKMTQEQTGRNNAFARVYDTLDYTTLLQYYGDVSNESYRTYSYELTFVKKNTACKD